MAQAAASVGQGIVPQLRFFRDLSEAELPVIAQYFESGHVPKGGKLWREEDRGDSEAFIVSGKVAVKKQTEFPDANVLLGVCGKGAVVGGLNIADRCPRAVTAQALEETDLLFLSRENFEKMTEEHPELGVKLLKGMLLAVSARLRNSYDRLATIF